MAKLHVLAFLVTLAGLSVSARELKLNIGGGGGSTEEEVHVVLEGLSGDVNVTIDSLGIPHISCVEDMDCFQAQGYFAARDRYVQIDVRRRLGEGKVAEMVALPVDAIKEVDRTVRSMMVDREGNLLEETLYKASSKYSQDACEAYAKGINAWLQDLRDGKNGAKLSEEYDFPLLKPNIDVEWTGIDIFAVVGVVLNSLTNRASNDISRGEVAAKLGVDVANLLVGPLSVDGGSTIGDFNIPWDGAEGGSSSGDGSESTEEPTGEPTSTTDEATEEPTETTSEATTEPTAEPTDVATEEPTEGPTEEATTEPATEETTTEPATEEATMEPATEEAGSRRRKLTMDEHLKRAANALQMADARQKQVLDTINRLGMDFGSNNWILGGDVTEDGTAILTNDPHLTLSQPGIWNIVELDSKTNGKGSLHTAGFGFAGSPFIFLGHNEDIAWGATVSFYDLGDVYLEELNEDNTAVIFDGEEVPLIAVNHNYSWGEETFYVVPHHGPILSLDPENHAAVSYRWKTNDATTDLDMFAGLNRATNIEEAKEAIDFSTTTDMNWIAIDKDSNIGWFPYSDVPKRGWDVTKMPNWMPLPGDGSAEWSGTYTHEELPQSINPDNGFIATANQDIAGDKADGITGNEGFPVLDDANGSTGTRFRRIVNMIRSYGNTHTPETCATMVADTKIWFAAQMVPVIQELMTEDDASTNIAQALDGWNFTCPTGMDGIDVDDSSPTDDEYEAKESIGCSAYHILVYKMLNMTFGDELDGTGYKPKGHSLHRSLHAALLREDEFPEYQQFWDNVATDEEETKEDIISSAIAAANDIAEAQFNSSDIDDWRWGKLHRLVMKADLFSVFTDNYDHVPVMAPGGDVSVNPAVPSGPDDGSGSMDFFHGPSFRAIYRITKDGIRAQFTYPGGNSEHQTSEFYDNLLEDWVNVNFVDFPFTPEEIEKVAVETHHISA